MHVILIYLCPQKTRPFTDSLIVCNQENKHAHMQGKTFTNKETSVRTETMETCYCEEGDWDIIVPRMRDNMATETLLSSAVPYETVRATVWAKIRFNLIDIVSVTIRKFLKI